MRKVCIAFIWLLLSTTAGSSQWRMIRDFYYAPYNIYLPVTCVYFMDFPGPPRIGFVGAGSELWKTTDGGTSWSEPWHDTSGESGEDEIADISFNDSLIGWFTFDGADAEVWRTEDGGNSWVLLPSSISLFPVDGIHYFKSSNRLFLCRGDTMLVSSDLGDTWQVAVNSQINGFSASSDSDGIASAYFGPSSADIDSDAGIIRTSNGGLNWVPVYTNYFTGVQPLAIAGKPLCFTAGGAAYKIFRSDDYGTQWNLLKDFGPPLDPTGNWRTGAPIGTGDISGDLSRLYIQTDTGMFISTDQGITWQFDGGPAALNSGQTHRFYAGHGVTFAGMDTGDDYGSLWEEIWPQSGVAEQPAAAGSQVLRIFPNPASNSITVEPAAGLVTIYDPLGRVYKIPVHGGTLDISSLPAGVYYVSEGSERTKFIKE